MPRAKQQLLNWFRQPYQQSVRLRQIVDRIRSSLELKVVLQTAVDEMATLLQLDRCSFLWYFQDTQRIQVVCEWVSNSERPSLLGYHPLSSLGAVAPAIAEGKLIIKSGTVTANSFGFLTRLFQSQQQQQTKSPSTLLGSSANLWVPVAGKEDWLGFIACGCDRPRRWSDAEIEFVQAIAQQLEIAIAQARLYDRAQKIAQRERLVNQITSQTRQSFNLETILSEAIAQLLEAMQADRCLVHLVGDTECDLDAPVSALRPIPTSKGIAYQRQHLYEVCRSPFEPSIEDFDPSGPITQWVVEHQQWVAIADIAQDPRIGSDNAEYQQAQIKSSLVVPVQANGNLHAILYLNQCAYKRYWSKNDQKLAVAVADQLAISIQQADLYGQIQQQAAASSAQAEYLATTLKQLQLTQAQLIQSEKMSSLGQLVAGIAHEINNPISFIFGNIPYVEWYINDLIRLIKAYQSQYPNPDVELQQILAAVELDFLERDLPQLLSSMNAGAERIREIILSLRNFARLDESQRKTVDLHEGIESTLLLLQSHFVQPQERNNSSLNFQNFAVAEVSTQDNSINIIRNYGTLPRVECYPGQLNQVFMSLLINAIEALKRQAAKLQTIKISTQTETIAGVDWVQIAIADNGPGIPVEIQSKIFDPFFTTKAVGQGAGLGLTISYQAIVMQHQGQLLCHSEPGKGTEIIVRLPVKFRYASSVSTESSV